ncbi:FAD-dependent oxidoreductase [Streptomyces sp. NPDC058240]|uniref:FAD-dependent oxidoreductase n=1 Tax=Streptomyces sp. NPDC058240 TaxID=3346396 RepID=UPI0036EF3E29
MAPRRRRPACRTPCWFRRRPGPPPRDDRSRPHKQPAAGCARVGTPHPGPASLLITFTGPVFPDCTGDGPAGHLAGAEYRIGREPRAEFGEAWAPEAPDAGCATPTRAAVRAPPG